MYPSTQCDFVDGFDKKLSRGFSPIMVVMKVESKTNFMNYRVVGKPPCIQTPIKHFRSVQDKLGRDSRELEERIYGLVNYACI